MYIHRSVGCLLHSVTPPFLFFFLCYFAYLVHSMQHQSGKQIFLLIATAPTLSHGLSSSRPLEREGGVKNKDPGNDGWQHTHVPCFFQDVRKTNKKEWRIVIFQCNLPKGETGVFLCDPETFLNFKIPTPKRLCNNIETARHRSDKTKPLKK